MKTMVADAPTSIEALQTQVASAASTAQAAVVNTAQTVQQVVVLVSRAVVL